MCGTFGFEMDIAEINPVDRALFREQIACFRAIAPIVRTGDLYRLWDPFKVPYTVPIPQTQITRL
jgi:alpha-galactosidase